MNVTVYNNDGIPNALKKNELSHSSEKDKIIYKTAYKSISFSESNSIQMKANLGPATKRNLYLFVNENDYFKCEQ